MKTLKSGNLAYHYIFVITITISIIINIIVFCFLRIFIRSIPSPTQEPQVRESREVKTDVFCIYLVLNIILVVSNSKS